MRRHENIACVTVAARQSSPRRDRQIDHPTRRNASILIDALHTWLRRASICLVLSRSRPQDCSVFDQRSVIQLLDAGRGFPNGRDSRVRASRVPSRRRECSRSGCAIFTPSPAWFAKSASGRPARRARRFHQLGPIPNRTYPRVARRARPFAGGRSGSRRGACGEDR
jgi:hypothetical protein